MKYCSNHFLEFHTMQDFLIIALLILTYLESIGIMYYSIATRLFSSLLRSEPSGMEQIIFHKKIRNCAVPVNFVV
jgi:hypothetical protein